MRAKLPAALTGATVLLTAGLFWAGSAQAAASDYVMLKADHTHVQAGRWVTLRARGSDPAGGLMQVCIDSAGRQLTCSPWVTVDHMYPDPAAGIYPYVSLTAGVRYPHAGVHRFEAVLYWANYSDGSVPKHRFPDNYSSTVTIHVKH